MALARLIFYSFLCVLPARSQTPDVTLTADFSEDVANLTCNVKRSNSMNFSYWWIHDGALLNNKNITTLSFSASILTNEMGSYTCVVRNGAGVGADSVFIGGGGTSTMSTTNEEEDNFHTSSDDIIAMTGSRVQLSASHLLIVAIGFGIVCLIFLTVFICLLRRSRAKHVNRSKQKAISKQQADPEKIMMDIESPLQHATGDETEDVEISFVETDASKRNSEIEILQLEAEKVWHETQSIIEETKFEIHNYEELEADTVVKEIEPAETGNMEKDEVKYSDETDEIQPGAEQIQPEAEQIQAEADIDDEEFEEKSISVKQSSLLIKRSIILNREISETEAADDFIASYRYEVESNSSEHTGNIPAQHSGILISQSEKLHRLITETECADDNELSGGRSSKIEKTWSQPVTMVTEPTAESRPS